MAPSAPWTSSMPFRASVRSASSSCATWWFRESHSARGRRGALRRARDCERRSHHAPRGRARGSTARRRSNEARCGLAASGLRGSVSPHRLVVGQRPARRARSERLALTRRHRGARPARHHRNRALDSLRTSRARTGQSLRAASLSRIGPARASSRSRTASREPARGDYDSPFAEAGEGWVRRTSLAQASGIHVVLRADRWRLVGRRGGLAGVGDRLRAVLAGSIARGLRGTRHGVIEGVVLGDEQALQQGLRERFRASGLYHLLAVSGQNVALVAAGALVLAWLLGLPRWFGQVAAIGAIAGYVLAVGSQPSVIRAGVAGALGSLAWLAARPADRWYFLLLGALILLAWNPYDALDAGFQLSFIAVAAIFVAVP